MTNEPQLIDHFHNGFDSSQIYFKDISQKKVWVHHTIVGTAAATATNYGVFWIAPFPCFITGFLEVHQTAGTNGGAVTLQLEKLNDGEAPDAGDVVLTTALSLKTTANTYQTGVLAAALGVRQLVIGDRLCMRDSGTLTDVANVTVIVEITMI